MFYKNIQNPQKQKYAHPPTKGTDKPYNTLYTGGDTNRTPLICMDKRLQSSISLAKIKTELAHEKTQAKSPPKTLLRH